MSKPDDLVIVDGEFLTVAVTDDVQLAIEDWTIAHEDTLNERLAPFGLRAAMILLPRYARVVSRRDLEPGDAA